MEKKVLATVNGREITEDNLNVVSAKFPKDQQAQLATPEGQKHLLNEVICWELMYDYGADNGYENKEKFKTQIEDAKRAIITQLVIEDTLKNVDVTDEELHEYFNQNKKHFNQPEEVNAKHILVDTIEKAKEIKKTIEDGMTFEEAAGRYSNCPSKAQGGSLNFFSRGMMVPEFEDAAFNLEKGVVSEPVKTQFGYHLILVVDKHEEKESSFEEVKDHIRAHMVQEKQNYTYMNFVEELKKKYNVVITH